MKITISNEVIVNAYASTRTMKEAYKDVLPEIEMDDDFNFNMNDIEPATWKWASIYVEDNNLVLDIGDTFIIDMMNAGTSMYAKFAPILGVARSMIPMFKRYIKDVQEEFVPVMNKYLEEYNYTVEEIKFPGVRAGYMILRKNRNNNGKWTLVDDRVCIFDEMQNMSRTALRNFRKEAVTTSVKTFNMEVEEGKREPAHMIPNEDAKFAAELMEEKFKTAMFPMEKENEEEVIRIIN